MVTGSKDLSYGITLNNNEITSPNEEKLLGILLDSKLNFEHHRGFLFRKAGQEINALARLKKLIYSDQRNLLLNCVIKSQFIYCPLTWMSTSKYQNTALKVQSCKFNKYMIAITKITNTEIFALIAVLVFKLFSRMVLFINRKDNKNN